MKAALRGRESGLLAGRSNKLGFCNVLYRVIFLFSCIEGLAWFQNLINLLCQSSAIGQARIWGQVQIQLQICPLGRSECHGMFLTHPAGVLDPEISTFPGRPASPGNSLAASSALLIQIYIDRVVRLNSLLLLPAPFQHRTKASDVTW